MMYVYTSLYGHAILMICFIPVFGDILSGVYGFMIMPMNYLF